MLLGYMRVSKADGSQVLDLQRDALLAAGVTRERLYQDLASGRQEARPGLEACLKALRASDTLVVWKLDRLGRTLRHLVTLVEDLRHRQVGFKVLTGQGAQIDTTTANGRMVFGIFAALAEFEAELIRERTQAGLVAARARGRHGGPGGTDNERHGGRRTPRPRPDDPVSLCQRRWFPESPGPSAADSAGLSTGLGGMLGGPGGTGR